MHRQLYLMRLCGKFCTTLNLRHLVHAHHALACLYRGRGAVTWFPVHCTSINNTNSLISGDNKGVAAQFLEGWAAGAARAGANSNESMGSGFVGAFGQANVGDTSPNVLGAFCYDTGAGTVPL